MEGKVFNLLVGGLIFLRKKRCLTISKAREKSLFSFFSPVERLFCVFLWGPIGHRINFK